MIEITKLKTYGWEEAIRGMRNSWNSWDKSDSGKVGFSVGTNDHELMKKLVAAGPDHRKFLRMITVYVDITAPLYWWKEFDTYKVGTVANSCSTMHTIAEKPFTWDDFSHEHLDHLSLELMHNIIVKLNANRNEYLEYKDCDDSINSKKDYWWQMIQLLPSSYNQKRTVMMNYEVLANIYESRKGHKLDEWRAFCSWVETLPHSDLIYWRKVK